MGSSALEEVDAIDGKAGVGDGGGGVRVVETGSGDDAAAADVNVEAGPGEVKSEHADMEEVEPLLHSEEEMEEEEVHVRPRRSRDFLAVSNPYY
jgi:hypothetical protein